MPKVGSKEFPYTRDGIAAAKAEAKVTGLPLKARKTYAETAHAQSDRAKKGAALAKQKAGGAAAAPGHGQQSAPAAPTAPFKGDAQGQPKPVTKAGK